MNKKILLLLICTILLVGTIIAYDFELKEYYEDMIGTRAYLEMHTVSEFRAGSQCFTPQSDQTIVKIGLNLTSVGSEGTLWGFLVESEDGTSAGSPNGTLVSTFTNVTQGTINNWGFYNMTFSDNNASVTNNQTYCIVLYGDGASSSDAYRWTEDRSGTYTYGHNWICAVYGCAVWGDNGGLRDMHFRTWAILSEEPVIDFNIIEPENNTISSETSLNFSSNYTISNGDSLNWTNMTNYIWYSNTSIFNTTTKALSGLIDNETIQVNDFSIGTYYHNIYACWGNVSFSNCSWVSNSNYTFTLSGEFSNSTYNSYTLETSRQTFSIILEILDSTIISQGSGKFVYNETIYSGITSTNIEGNKYNLSKTIFLPSGTTGFNYENRTFYWNVSVVDINSGISFLQISDTYYHNVTEIKFGLCSATLTIPMLNFTLYDENLGTQINSSVNLVDFQTTFNIGAYYGNLLKNVSVNNLSVDTSEFDFCTSNETNIFYSNMELLFGADEYAEKNYYLTNASLSNTTNEINLYLLNESNSIEFFIDVVQDLSAVTSAKVTIQKYFVGEGVYKTVEIDETSSDTGEFTSYLDLDKDYRFIIVKNGNVLGTITKTASCKEAPCEITLSLISELSNVYSVYDDNFAKNILYNLSWNPNTKIVTFEFIDTTGLANYFRMNIAEQKMNQSSSSYIFDSNLYSSSGIITANLSAYEKGDFIVNTYISRSPEKFIDYLKITINAIAGVFGTLGLFIAFILIITIIFGLAHSPPTLVFSIPLALTLVKLIGILSIDWIAITILYILAGISWGAMQK